MAAQLTAYLTSLVEPTDSRAYLGLHASDRCASPLTSLTLATGASYLVALQARTGRRRA